MKILIIEDDKPLATTIKLVFKKLNISSDHAATGEEGKDFLASYSYDLILLDVLLPDMTGFEFLKYIREDKITTPVLILSGLNDSKDKIQGLNHGADDYLTKPFNKDELIARVNAIVRRSQGHSQQVITIGDLNIYLENKQISINGTNVAVTKKEYSILETLALKKGKVVSKEQLLDHLYNDLEEEPGGKIIDVFVCKLRKKLSKISGKNYIHTIWGLGYMINLSEEK